MIVTGTKVLQHSDYGGGYRLLRMSAPQVAAAAAPGQFIHLKVPMLDGRILRRPFSIFTADDNELAVLYKVVGRGTEAMRHIDAGDELSIIGPLGNGFPAPGSTRYPVLVGGGFGVAPLYLLAQRMNATGTLFVGGRTAEDILCTDLFRELGWEVSIATEDGSLGVRGYVTEALDRALRDESATFAAPEFFVCGPEGLLRAIGERAVAADHPAWLSLDKHMGCGVGACLACVQKIRGTDGQPVWKRVCKDGPVFEAAKIIWD